MSGKIFVTSDTHFCHNRDFLYAPRGCVSPDEMNKLIVKKWNSLVTEDDEVYHLGDVMLNNDDEGLKLLKQLNGFIHIIRGNHDSDQRIAKYIKCHNVVEVRDAAYLHYGKYHFFLSHFPCICSNFDYDKPLKARTINLCGHTHTQDKWANWEQGVIYHCELDAHGVAPVALDDVIVDLEKKMRENTK